MGSPGNPNWVFDYGCIDDIPVPGGDLLSFDPPNFSWPSHSLTTPPPDFSVELDDSFGNSDGFNESGSKKRFLELGSILDPGRPTKMDKAVILSDAVRMLSQLRGEAQKLRESNENLQEKINELKAEKNELRHEKQRLKLERDNIEQRVKVLSSQPGFLPHPPTLSAPFPVSGQVFGGKMVPFMGYPGVSMWQFLPPAAVDTSQDHVLRPPVA
ncbi:transcription factor ILR3-like [Senna tora]|uniref:Transcription factor ILR3-like n=1 Tax=Senna tora TaxID=362788 RepID=A0A834VYF4_9FABA|nr:transcription factor ILR3-like [Senna tora]